MQAHPQSDKTEQLSNWRRRNGSNGGTVQNQVGKLSLRRGTQRRLLNIPQFHP
jgi:hypothetical protein